MKIDKAKTPYDLKRKTYKLYKMEGEWKQAFSYPSAVGLWFIWGGSGNGKTSFLIQTMNALLHTPYITVKNGKQISEDDNRDKILYNSLEEGDDHTQYEAWKRGGLLDAKRIQLVQEPIEKLTARLNKRQSPRIVVIDSYQYTHLSFKEFLKFINQFPNKLFIVNSHAEGKNPEGRPAKKVMFHASLKIWIEGYKAFSKGRYIGETGEYTIWQNGADEYYGNANNNN